MSKNGSRVTIKEYVDIRFTALEKRFDKLIDNDLCHMDEKIDKVD